MNNEIRIAPERLLDFATAVYGRVGMPEAGARLAADTLVQADLWGDQSHGVMRLSWYVACLRAGVCEPVAKPEFAVDARAIAVVDGREADGSGADRPGHGGSHMPDSSVAVSVRGIARTELRSIAVFAIDPGRGTLKPVAFIPSTGKHRDFLLLSRMAASRSWPTRTAIRCHVRCR